MQHKDIDKIKKILVYLFLKSIPEKQIKAIFKNSGVWGVAMVNDKIIQLKKELQI